MTEEERDSKEYSWKWVGAAELLCKVACDLVYAKLVSDTDVGNGTLYNGEDDSGEAIIKLATAYIINMEIAPPKPIYCPRGLYVGTLTSCDIFVMWRVRTSKEG